MEANIGVSMSKKRTWVYERRKHLIKRCTFPSNILDHLIENGLMSKEQCVICQLEQTRESKMRVLLEQLSPQNIFGLYDAIEEQEKYLFEDLNKNFTKEQIVQTPEQATWVSSHREKLIKMCSFPERILDHLLDNGMLSDEEYSRARTEQTRENKMKLIFEHLSHENLSGLYHAIKDEEQELFLKLNKTLVQKPTIRALSPRPSEYNDVDKTPLRRVMRVNIYDGTKSNYKLAMVGHRSPNRDTTEHNNDSTSKYLIGLARSCQQSDYC